MSLDVYPEFFARAGPAIFLQRPISAGLLLATVILLVAVALPMIRRGREKAFAE